MTTPTRRTPGIFTRLAKWTAHACGRPGTFALVVLLVVAWAVSGPFFHYSDSWQLTINTFTTIVTFLMVFLIQATQNRDGKAVQLKLDELIRAQTKARNVFAALEDAGEDEIKRFEEEFRELRQSGLPRERAVREAARRTQDD